MGQDGGLRFVLRGSDSFRLVLGQQYLAAVGAGEEDGQRLLFLPCRYNGIPWWQPDVREGLYDSNDGARRFHQCEVLWEIVRPAGSSSSQ